jgi:hypothetical protein
MKSLLSSIGWQVLVVVVLGLCAYGAWLYLKPPLPQVDAIVPAIPAPALNGTKKVELKTPIITVYAPKAKAKLNLPKAQQADSAFHVIEATQVNPDDHPVTVITTLNTDTGLTETVTRREPYPWFAFKNTGEMRLDYGLKGSVKVARISLRQDFLQVKSVYASAVASLYSDGQTFIGVGVAYRW